MKLENEDPVCMFIRFIFIDFIFTRKESDTVGDR